MQFKFLRELQLDAADLGSTYDVAFFGQTLDDRGIRSLALSRASAVLTHAISYVPAEFVLTVDGKTFRADARTEFVAEFPAKKVLLDATTLDLPELLLLCAAYCNDPAVEQIGFVYVEPEGYKSNAAAGGTHAFSLSSQYSLFNPIPGFTPELSRSRAGRLLAFLGFEPSRLQRVISAIEDGLNIKSFSVAFGVPPYKASWEMHALMQNADVLADQSAEDVHYIGANNPFASYQLIEQTARTIDADTERLVLAPLGTKPASISVALFAAMNPNVRLMFDFPTRVKDRTYGVSRIHYFSVIPR